MCELFLKLNEIGINTTSSLQRLNFDKQTYVHFIDAFIKDKSFSNLEEALNNHDFQKALIYATSLQGISSNLGIVKLETKCKKLCLFIHENADCKDIFQSLKKEYFKTIVNIIFILRRYQ